MRWLFRPPHLTLKPSKTKNHKNKRNKKKKKQAKKQEKTQNTKKRAFQLSMKFFVFWWVSNISFLTTWPRKRAPPKHYKNWGGGGSANFFLKKQMRHETAIFGPKKQIHKFQLSFFCLFLLFWTTKTQQIAETPNFYSVLANIEKRFQTLNLKQRNLNWKKNQFLHPFSKSLFLENCQKIRHNIKTQNGKWVCKNRLKPL